jgi:hypothetical protein
VEACAVEQAEDGAEANATKKQPSLVVRAYGERPQWNLGRSVYSLVPERDMCETQRPS